MIMLAHVLAVIMNVVVTTMVEAAKWVGFTLAYLGLKPGLEAQTASPTLPLQCTLQYTAVQQ